MDKSVIERFSINARIKLRDSVDSSMAKLGFGPGRGIESIQSVGDITIITLPGGIQTKISNDEARQREKLADIISKEGYDNVVEKIAYTWFNRLIAVRYMEVNDFLPTHVRVLSSNIPDKIEPDIVSQCLTVDLNITEQERETIKNLRDSNRLDELFSKMFIFECKSLNKILPELFTITKPYENMLLNISYTNPDGVVRLLVDEIPEDDFRDAVQIIGWMYQYYNSELKDETFANLKKSVKIPKERIPAVTQLFTPDWIVRYMVENSVGRVWIEGHPDQVLKSSWKYYVEEAEQNPDAVTKLVEIRAPYVNMIPSDIKVIDPCMGSGHVLAYAFDVLMQIYLSYGYSKPDAAETIITNNLYGLDIDDRAYQLAYFAIMMKGRQYDPDFFSKNLKPNIHPIPESNHIDADILEDYGKNLSTIERTTAYNDLLYLLSTFKNAKTYGSLLKIHDLNWASIKKFLDDRSASLFSNSEIDSRIHEIVEVAYILSIKFHAVITNPPYMNASGMNSELSDFVKSQYADSKTDLFACFINRCISMSRMDGYTSMITQQNFMFLSSFELLRHHLIEHGMFCNMLHLGPHAFDQIGGEVVQSVSFTFTKSRVEGYKGTYYRLVEGGNEEQKRRLFVDAENKYIIDQKRFDVIPGSPMTYWLSDNMISCFTKGTPLSEIASPRQGLATGENARFIRQWFEVSFDDISFNCTSRADSVKSGKKWFPYNKGGEYRKWYGNNDFVIDWKDDGASLRNFKDNTGKPRSVLRNQDYYFKPSITWSKISSDSIAFRYKPPGHIFDVAGTSIFAAESIRRYIHGFCNSCVALSIASAISPTLNYEVGHIANFPIIMSADTSEIDRLVQENIDIAKEEWDSFEISWDYKTNPLVHFNVDGLISTSYSRYSEHIDQMIARTKRNEERLNEIFIKTYGLEDELSPYVEDNHITLRLVSSHDAIRHLISYAVGCMFGRYSLDTLGIQYAGGNWVDQHGHFAPDSDNIIPINENEYFGDDIASRFVSFIKLVFGSEHLEDNLKFIANSLDIKKDGTARDKIRFYFINEFYKDHLKMYSNLPIYWLFDSGNNNGFKALIYIHRYKPDLIGKMRQDYLLPMQRRYSEQIKTESDPILLSKLEKKLEEISTYDLAMELYSANKICLDLDDGIKANYAKFQNIDNPGGKGKINLLHKIK